MKTSNFQRRRPVNGPVKVHNLQEKRLAKVRKLIDEIDDLKQHADDVKSMLNHKVIADDDDGVDDVPQFNIFRKGVDEDEMAQAFYEVYDHLFGNQRVEMLDGGYKKELDLAAYLFYVVDNSKLGRYDFSSNAVKPFYEFFKTKVLPEMKGTRKTLYNRIKTAFDDLGKPEAEQKMLARDGHHQVFADIYRNYQKVRDFFHKTEYGMTILI